MFSPYSTGVVRYTRNYYFENVKVFGRLGFLGQRIWSADDPGSNPNEGIGFSLSFSFSMTDWPILQIRYVW